MSWWCLTLLSFLHWLPFISASDCNGDPFLNYTCPAKGGFYCEFSNSLAGSIIIRCLDGCPSPGNCDDNLFCYPSGTANDKQDASCYQDSPTAGNAQCTSNCVNVTRVDGSVFYPLGCVSSALTLQPSASACSLNSNNATPTLPAGIIKSSDSTTSTTSKSQSTTSSSSAAAASTSHKSSGTSILRDAGLRRWVVVFLAVVIGLCC